MVGAVLGTPAGPGDTGEQKCLGQSRDADLKYCTGERAMCLVYCHHLVRDEVGWARVEQHSAEGAPGICILAHGNLSCSRVLP